MTYPKQFTEFQRAQLERVVPSLKAMEPGDILRVGGVTVADTELIRYLVYAWLSPQHENLKHLFRIRKGASPLEFLVERRAANQPTLQLIKAPQGEHPFLERIVHLTDEEEAEEAIRGLGLLPEEAIRLLNDWRKIHGG